MNVLRLAGFELRRFRTPVQRLALAFLVAVPLLYGALYLWSNWNPYGELDRIPVAVVNQDRPVTVPDPSDPAGKRTQTVTAGSDLTAALRRDRIFDWRFTGATDAAAGLHAGRYYATLTIPPSFSADLTSAATGPARRANVDMRRDDGNGYVIGLLINTAGRELEHRIDEAATTAYFESVYGGLDALRTDLTQARDGAVQLRDGLAEEKRGTGALVAGLQQSSAGATQLAGGLDQLTAGAGRLAAGAQQVADGNRRLAAAVDPLVARVLPALPRVAAAAVAANDATGGFASLGATGSDTVAARARASRDALVRLGNSDPRVKRTAAYRQALAAANRTVARADQVSTAARRVTSATGTLAADTRTLRTEVPRIQSRLRAGARGIDQLATGAQQVADGADRLHSGLATASDGADRLRDGQYRLLDGARRLDAGAARLHDGASRLATGLSQAVDRLPAADPAQRQRDAQILGSPANVNTIADHDARTYGRGLSPFFFSIALWVFGIAAFLVLRPTTGRALAGHARSAVVAIAGWLPIFAVCTVGGLLLLTVVWLALGLDPAHPAGTIALVLLGAACFTALAHLFRLALGLVGSAVTLILLVLQLAAAGGIYPVATLPAPLRWLHPLLPMTYLIDGFRVTMTGGNGVHLARDAAVLAAALTVTLLLTLAVVARRRTWTPARLHPPLGL